MYLMNEILDFAPGRRQECLDRLDWIHGLMANKPGFQRALVARYLGNPTRHTILRIWQDEASFSEFRAGPDGNYGRGRPEGLYVNEPVVPRWAGYDEVAGTAQGSYIVKVQTHVEADAQSSFLEHQAHVNEWVRSIAGLVSMTQWRSPEGNDFLNVLRFTDDAAFKEIFDNPARVVERSAMPESVSPSNIECFEIVREIFPA